MSTSRHTREVFPAGLLIEGRPCLVVGGGKVALRKARHLLDAGAEVTVVCAEPRREIVDLASAGQVQHVAHHFSDGDVNGSFLVFAATNDRSVNRDVLRLCRNKGILCCSVDGSWTSGDFVTPAIFRKGELTVAVSTGGRSCRRSRLVKDNLARHVEMVETAELIVMGTSHHLLKVEERERYHLEGERLAQAGQMLMQIWGIHEFMVLNTCNRIELIAIVARESAIEGVLRRILGFDHLSSDQHYVRRGFEAFRHVSEMTAGLLSQTPGENHIVAQVKDALAEGVEAGWANGMLQECIASSLHVSKDIRAATASLLKGFEIEDLCLEYLAAHSRDLSDQHVMVIGAGVVGVGLVRNVLQHVHSCEWCYHVNPPDVPGGWEKRVQRCTLNELPDRLPHIDTVICATASSGDVLDLRHAPFFNQEHDIVIIDLGMPRNVAPALNGLMSNLRVVNLDDLKHWYRREAVDMSRVLELSKQTVEEHSALYEKIMHSFQGGNKGQ